ncbi:MAG: four helix bundle protein, partial [Planctomycetota bacterium]
RVEAVVDRTIQMVLALPNNAAGWEISRQIIRSSGSVGANLEESQAASSRKDFANRLGISFREGRETQYWIRRIENNKLFPAKRLKDLKKEWSEIVAMITTIKKKLSE